MACCWLAPIVEKSRRCVRMLSSDRDGEVVAAARALCRTLKSNGLDIHALADSIGQANGHGYRKLDKAEEQQIYDRGFAAGKRAVRTGSSPELSWHEIARECAEHPQRLRNEREREFIKHMVGQTLHGGQLSEKQADWLRAGYVRVRR
jgi:hypothetical protein